MTATILVLRFASGIKVDLVDCEDDRTALADFVARCLKDRTVDLPLIEAHTCPVPRERILELAGRDAPPALVAIPTTPRVPVVGLVRAIAPLAAELTNPNGAASMQEAKIALGAFLHRHGVEADFRTERQQRREAGVTDHEASV